MHSVKKDSFIVARTGGFRFISINDVQLHSKTPVDLYVIKRDKRAGKTNYSVIQLAKQGESTIDVNQKLTHHLKRELIPTSLMGEYKLLVHKNDWKEFVTRHVSHVKSHLPLFMHDPDFNESMNFLRRAMAYAFQNLADDHRSQQAYNICRQVAEATVSLVQNTAFTDKRISLIFASVSSEPYGELHIHSANVAVYSLLMAVKAGFRSDVDLLNIALGGLLHDVGKLEIPQHILNKQDRLTCEEWEIVRKHPVIGRQILQQCSDLSRQIRRIVEQHHENCDGSGYPYGLKGSEIAISSQIVHVVDVFDALTSERIRPDRPLRAMTVDEAIELMRQQSGMFNSEIFTDLIKTCNNFSPIAPEPYAQGWTFFAGRNSR